MPKAQLHWAHDLLAVALVGGISGLVFWLLPPAELARTTAACNVDGVASGAMISRLNAVVGVTLAATSARCVRRRS
jgi:hypothetical protein